MALQPLQPEVPSQNMPLVLSDSDKNTTFLSTHI